jgi:hypothetical protein
VLALALASSARTAGAQLLASTARQSSSGSLKILGYYQGVQDQTLNFNTNSSGLCTSGTASFPCGQGSDTETKGKGGAGMIKLIWQPWDRFQYYGMVGAGDYTLSVPSTTVTNVFTGDNVGLIYGFGLKASIVPDTIVAAEGLPSPAIALDASITQSRYNFNRVFPGGTPGVNGNIDERLTMTAYSVAVEASHLFTLDQFWKLEPYGGVKWTRVSADLKDLGSGSHAGGQTDTVTPFLGLRVPIEDHEAFFAEGSFVDGYHYGGGLELRFK